MTEAQAGPIQSIRLKNFRRFEDTGEIRLAPVTLVLGKNSSGKTSLLRSLLLVKQIIAAATFEDVPLAGPYADFGSYREFAFGGELSRDVSIELRLKLDGQPRRGYPKSFYTDDIETFMRGTIVELVLHWNKRMGRPQFTSIKFHSAEDPGLFLNFSRRGPKSFVMESQLHKVTVPFSLTYGNLRRMPLDQRSLSLSKAGAKAQGRRDYTLWLLMDAIGEVFDDLQYVGPLRDMPDRAYRIDQLSPESPTASVVNLLDRQKQAQATMSQALRDLGMARDVSLSVLAPGYVGIVLTDPVSGRVDNLTDVGFGVSQVLPVIAAVATATRSATIMIEQPELHLHPDAQGRLADVLVNLLASKQASLLVETHSEHILIRVLRRVAEGVLASESVSIVVVDDGEVRSLGVDELGRLINGSLPLGFFEEDWEDTMLLAKAAAIRAAEQ